ncbi:MAG: hypothetical protein ABTQ34_05725 [Bdellovibrionales bacterium]
MRFLLIGSSVCGWRTCLCGSSARLGIAIGPILFVIAMIGVLSTAMMSGIGNFGTASVADRISINIITQANLIRAKINECNLTYGTDSNYDGYPSSDTTNGTLVSALLCQGDNAGLQNIWSGTRVTSLPPPPPGFGPWRYINTNGTGFGGTAAGGRCIWIAPTSASPSSNAGIVTGLTKAASKFTQATANDGASEVNYNPASSTQRFVVWITPPAVGAEDDNCKP